MQDPAPEPIGWRWLIIGARVTMIWAVFILMVPFHLLLSLVGQRKLLPPRFLKLVGWLTGLRIRVQGRPAKGRLLLLGNHVSWLDIMALSGASGTAFVAHGGLADRWLLRWLCKQNDTLFVARERRSSVAQQIEQVRRALMSRRMVIFPEGTTSDGHAMLPFKSALLSAVEGLKDGAVRVQPVALHYRRAADIAWNASEHGVDNVLRILARTRPIMVTVRFLHPLSGKELRDRKAMAKTAQAAIERSLTL